VAGPKRFAASGRSLRPSDSIVERGSVQRTAEVPADFRDPAAPSATLRKAMTHREESAR
jgi:hypothetical protein